MRNISITLVLQGIIILVFGIFENSSIGFLFGFFVFLSGYFIDAMDNKPKREIKQVFDTGESESEEE